MLNWLKPNAKKHKQKEYERLIQAAFVAQRNGDIRGYSELTAQAEAVKKQLDSLA